MNERMAVALAFIVIIVAVVGFILYEAPNAASNSKNFGYSYSVIPSQTHSIQVTNTNGPINVINWNNSQIVINGTVTSNGFGASPSDARLSQSDTNGAIIFSANQSSSFFFFGGYTVSINVYVPSGLNFAFLKVTTVNGEVKTSQLNSASVDASSVNGELSVACNCLETHLSTTNGGLKLTLSNITLGGSYSASSVNGGISLNVPRNSSFDLSASTVLGSIQLSGLPGAPSPSGRSVSFTYGSGNSSISLSTVNGGISIAGY